MRNRIIVGAAVVCLILFFLNYENVAAKKKSPKDSSMRIGAVEVRKIFEDSQRNADYKKQAEGEQKRVLAELDRLKAEIEAERAGLNTLKPGSAERMTQVKTVLTKQANYNALQEYHQQELALKERQWIESIYKDVLRIVGEIAQQKGLDLVLESSEPELTDMSAEGLVMAIRTHKLLYSGGDCLDITNEVVARLDAGK